AKQTLPVLAPHAPMVPVATQAAPMIPTQSESTLQGRVHRPQRQLPTEQSASDLHPLSQFVLVPCVCALLHAPIQSAATRAAPGAVHALDRMHILLMSLPHWPIRCRPLARTARSRRTPPSPQPAQFSKRNAPVATHDDPLGSEGSRN